MRVQPGREKQQSRQATIVYSAYARASGVAPNPLAARRRGFLRPDFCRVVYTGAYVNSARDIFFFLLSLPFPTDWYLATASVYYTKGAVLEKGKRRTFTAFETSLIYLLQFLFFFAFFFLVFFSAYRNSRRHRKVHEEGTSLFPGLG